jgi:hypothetical protein
VNNPTADSPGYPANFEFRRSPDGRQFAIWEPGNEPWFVPEAHMPGRWFSSADMDRLGWTRYLPVGQAPATDQTDLRQRIAAALYERERPPRDPHWPDVYAADREVFEAMADAVLAVLPAPTDRATVLREAADIAESLRQFERATGARWSAQVSENVGILRVADHLRRLAGEAATPEHDTEVGAEPGTCGHRSPEGHPCNRTPGHLGYHRRTQPDTDLWTSWVGELPEPAAECGTRHYQHPDTVCTEPSGHYQRATDPHAGPLILDSQECGRVAWDEPAVGVQQPKEA